MYAKLLNQAIYKTSLVLKHVLAKQILVKKLLCDLSLYGSGERCIIIKKVVIMFIGGLVHTCTL